MRRGYVSVKLGEEGCDVVVMKRRDGMRRRGGISYGIAVNRRG